MPIIAGCDIGINTGFAIVDVLPKPLLFKPILALELKGSPRDMALFIAKQEFDFIAVEQFALVQYYAREVAVRDHFLITARTQGALEALIPYDKLFIQLPSTKRYSPDEKLKELGMWNKSRHINDAFRHILFFSRRFTREMNSNKKIVLSDFYSA
jgi:beta-lactamase class D